MPNKTRSTEFVSANNVVKTNERTDRKNQIDLSTEY